MNEWVGRSGIECLSMVDRSDDEDILAESDIQFESKLVTRWNNDYKVEDRSRKSDIQKS